MITILFKIPKEFITSAMGSSKGFSGIFRATMAGVLLDLCSHGILMIGVQLYKKESLSGKLWLF